MEIVDHEYRRDKPELFCVWCSTSNKAIDSIIIEERICICSSCIAAAYDLMFPNSRNIDRGSPQG